jgi:ribose transport system substrate-binding protein
VKRISLSTRRGTATLVLALVAVAAAAIGVTGAASHTAAKPKIAYLSFAVANSYDAPMLAAAKKVAKAQGAGSIAVFDANNDPAKQLEQLQTLVQSRQYNGIILQPIFGPQLLATVRQAFQAGIKVVNIDQILGSNPGTAKPPLAGLSGNVVFVQSQIGRKQGKLVVKACKGKNPCKVGYMYSVKVSSLDTAIRKGFDAVTKGHNIQVVAEGQTFYTPSVALQAAQTMLQGHPDINLIVGADQAATGAEAALGGKKVILVGYGGGAHGLQKVKAGKWYGTVMQRPATEGKLGMKCLIKAVKTGKGCKGIDVLANLPNGGVVTKANVKKFHAEWPG